MMFESYNKMENLYLFSLPIKESGVRIGFQNARTIPS